MRELRVAGVECRIYLNGIDYRNNSERQAAKYCRENRQYEVVINVWNARIARALLIAVLVVHIFYDKLQVDCVV